MGGEGADGVEDGEAVAAAAGVAAAAVATSTATAGTGFPPGEQQRRGVPAGDLDPLDELLEALVVDEGGLPLGDDAGLVLPRELHHPPRPPLAAPPAVYVVGGHARVRACLSSLLAGRRTSSLSHQQGRGARGAGGQGQAGVVAEATLLRERLI